MDLEVLKFGGSILATKKNFIDVKNIITQNTTKKLIVVSAMGRSGFPYSSDNLLSLVNSNYLSTSEYHHLLANGEIIASIVLSNYLKENGLKSQTITYLKNGIKYINNEYILDDIHLKNYLKEYDYLIAPGFIGRDEENEVITLGRGNSDLSAILYAKMFLLNEVYLYKDVAGIYPFLHYPLSNVIPYKEITSKELHLLLENGMKIISLDALNAAIKYNITIHVLPFFEKGKGSKVTIENKIKKAIIGLIIENKTFKIITQNEVKTQQEMKEIFKSTHALIKKEEIKENLYSFVLKSSQSLLIKRKIIDFYFKNHLKEN